jgi:hypothetical protein
VDGLEVAREIYNDLFGGEGELLDAGAIPYALDAAVTRLRRKGLHPSRWVPYIHLGM